MKQKLLYVLIIFFVTFSCNNSTKNNSENVVAKIEYWNLLCDSITYSGEIDEVSKVILVKGISNPNNIKGVSYKLSSGATIQPKLDSVEWKETQVFNVLNHPAETVYTVIIKP